MHGDILTKYLALGPATFGLPTTDETGVPGYGPGRKSELLGATIYWSGVTGAWEVHGEIRNKWLASGGPLVFGMPTSDEQNVTGIEGKWNQFQNANIYWSAVTTAHEVHGAILAKYLEGGGVGGPAGPLGLPITDEYSSGSGRRSDFDGGYIYWEARSGAQVYAGAVNTMTADTTFEARDGNGALLATLGAGQVASVRYNKITGIYSVQAPGVYLTGTSYIRFTATGGIVRATSYHDVPSWDTSLDDNKFRGTIEVRYSPVSDAVWIVNELPVEDYMKGIAETSSGSPAEFLRTMTVAARSYAIWHLDRNGKYGGSEIFHLKNSRNGNGDDQVYKGYGLEARFPTLVTAVNTTAGQVVTYDGTVAMTSYFSNSDGRTRSALEVWGVDYWPWLASVSEPYDAGMTMAGHGVGLSGHGALARANLGVTYSEILGYYYTGTVLSTVNTNRNIRIAISHVTP
ncbi:MAG: SpoIID/LytB domain-containing protein, partial [Thermoleophilia bacterium]